MSCSLCRLPFVPNEQRSTNPHPPPRGILSAAQTSYHSTAIAWGQSIMTLLLKFNYLDNNLFGADLGMMPIVHTWEKDGGTCMFFHTTCADLLRHALDAEAWTVETFVRLFELESVFGQPQGGREAGRFRHVDYEHVACERAPVDLRRFWLPKPPYQGRNWDWEGFAGSEFAWTLNRPDVFPRFFATVSEKRLGSVGRPEATTDRVTTLPIDVLLHLLPHLDVRTYLALTSTCRTLRTHALTTFQPHARRLVLSLGWAVPLAGEHEQAKAAGLALAHARSTPHDADWFLYLGHVHRTAGMRVRRWVWHVCENVRRAYEGRRAEVLFARRGDGALERNEEGRRVEEFVQATFALASELAGREV
ncbi:hypothetical protein HETIRDRAFT_439691 [Heterobasidion irregulare TC 32-1]|uniref:F-box domain-containing protein n=1 Tax=Heterobasidion irregulare (strain TC 32-1) TaxID=747525 RepID=W4KDQ0_HETIT|nr:uncharacterized protein HETIRDRAFT_439691 [Heterobasidion irregulare TC 32-1]ETW83201.1 hypothetical protein HETIRDRAFT_439691 [Heterobasidion irregulare TC 32-1]